MKTIAFRDGEREEPEKETEKRRGESKDEERKLGACGITEPREKRRRGQNMWTVTSREVLFIFECDLGLCCLTGKRVER